jgi:hypothetical protein
MSKKKDESKLVEKTIVNMQSMLITAIRVDGGTLYLTELFHLEYGRFRGSRFFVSTTFAAEPVKP